MPVRAADSATSEQPATPDLPREPGSTGRRDAEPWSPERRAARRAGFTTTREPAAGGEGPRPREHPSRVRARARPAALLLVPALLGALGGLVWGSAHPVEFLGRSDVLVESNVSLTGDLQTFEVTERDVTTQRSLIASPTVVREASRLAGTDLTDATSVSTTQDSNVLTLQVVAPTREGARRATDAYVRSYLSLVADRQRLQVEASLALAQASASAASEAVDRLDGAVAATSPAQQPVLLSLQSAERGSLAQQQRDAQQRISQLQDTASRLPVNLQRYDRVPALSPTGFSGRTWVLLGLAAGLAVGAMVLARLAERRP